MNAPSIPVIDISGFNTGSKARASAIAEQIKLALREFGFFYVIGHDVPEDLQEELIAEARGFFAKPLDEKMKIAMELGGKAWRGYFPPGGELTSGRPDRKEGIYFGREMTKVESSGLPLHGPNQFANESMRRLVLDYMSRMTDLGHLLMEGISLALGLPRDEFRKRVSETPTTLFRIFNYQRHVWSAEADEWGVREHSDYGLLTLLRQDASGGLQVKASGGGWIEAPPIPGSLVVNIGDMLEVWTHGIFRATPHRVRNQGAIDRISLPFFFDPGWSARLASIDPSKLPPADLKAAAADRSPRWDALDLRALPPDTTYGDYLWKKVEKVFPALAGNNR